MFSKTRLSLMDLVVRSIICSFASCNFFPVRVNRLSQFLVFITKFLSLALVVCGPVQPYRAESRPKAPFVEIHFVSELIINLCPQVSILRPRRRSASSPCKWMVSMTSTSLWRRPQHKGRSRPCPVMSHRSPTKR